jgi:hypothetical protein
MYKNALWFDQYMTPQKYDNLEAFTAEIMRSIDTVPIEGIQNAVKMFQSRVRKVKDSKGDNCHNIN